MYNTSIDHGKRYAFNICPGDASRSCSVWSIARPSTIEINLIPYILTNRAMRANTKGEIKWLPGLIRSLHSTVMLSLLLFSVLLCSHSPRPTITTKRWCGNISWLRVFQGQVPPLNENITLFPRIPFAASLTMPTETFSASTTAPISKDFSQLGL